jgi:hypothetical protein
VVLAALAESAWRRRDDATAVRWFRRLLAVDPDDKDTAELLANLAPVEVEPAEPTRFDLDFLVVEADEVETMTGDTVRETAVVSDPTLLSWVLSSLSTAAYGEALESGEVRTYRRGRHSTSVRAEPGQDAREWDAARAVELGERPLPFGHPARIDGRTRHYGYTMIPPS